MKKEIKTKQVTDCYGKNYLVKELTAIDKFNLVRILGADAENISYLSLCGALSSIAEINGVPVPPPQTMNDFYALLDDVGEVGLAVVAETLKSLVENIH